MSKKINSCPKLSPKLKQAPGAASTKTSAQILLQQLFCKKNTFFFYLTTACFV